MKHLDLFSGIGGFALAARWAGIETVGFCEIEEFARKVLKKNFAGVKIHHDIRELNGEDYEGIDLVTGGYPCQPFSTAGTRKGIEDDRHLWPEMFRVITQARPAWVICENVVGHVTLGLDMVLHDLESEGYTTRTFIIPACGVGARHRRKRVWVVAYSDSYGWSGSEVKAEEDRKIDTMQQPPLCVAIDPWDTVHARQWGRVDGLPKGLDKDRIKAIGNAIVPQVAYQLLRCLKAH